MQKPGQVRNLNGSTWPGFCEGLVLGLVEAVTSGVVVGFPTLVALFGLASLLGLATLLGLNLSLIHI